MTEQELPELLYEVLSLLDDIDSSLQGGLLLLAKALDQVLNCFHRLCINVIEQLFLKLLQPCPQLTMTDGKRLVS